MLLFLPGLACDARIYEPQLAAFADSRAVNGYGLADTLQDMARIVLDQAPDSFDLLGHSMGGRVALEVYRMAPERVRRLALVSTGIHPLRDGEPASRRALQQVGWDNGFEALIYQWLPPMVAEANRADPAIYGPLHQMNVEAGQEVFDAQIHALVNRPDVMDLLPQISCPTLVMTGELDTWAPPAQHETIAAAIPGAELVIVPGAGHMIQLEAPEGVNSAIAGWLARPA
ncbi:alpha/beta fold hydrolase [Altererythrobacter salegens]|uniref:Alpha/beta fold hydrolase n=1 Tax=Croceibacterium salegens TaxID=1737568 RepID=A0A6I4SW07_9SPHN|nr:alpha/beta hydrolase [Croceibacterium salegens]MXO58956.1 alpha/beta fold hydrolase [Croceibacterium salegens]